MRPPDLVWFWWKTSRNLELSLNSGWPMGHHTVHQMMIYPKRLLVRQRPVPSPTTIHGTCTKAHHTQKLVLPNLVARERIIQVRMTPSILTSTSILILSSHLMMILPTPLPVTFNSLTFPSFLLSSFALFHTRPHQFSIRASSFQFVSTPIPASPYGLR